MLDYYKILGVNQDSSASKIKKAYRQFGFKWHPEMNPENKDQARRRFQMISEAYQVLTNDKFRKIYEKYYNDRFSDGGREKFKTINLNSQLTFRDHEELFKETFNAGRNKSRDDSNGYQQHLIDMSSDRSNDKSNEPSTVKTNANANSKVTSKRLTRAIGIDCEMVGVGDRGSQSVLARVSLVNQFGDCIYDKYVKPTEPVTDYRTSVSGIRPEDIANGEDFKTVQKEVYNIVNSKNRILVGHALRNDLKVLILDHAMPRSRIRDTSVYFRKLLKGKTPSLKRLTSQILGADIQCGEHDSVQDAKAAMMLYTIYKKKWEAAIKEKRNPKATKNNVEKNKPSS